MGCGKSSVGRRISALTGHRFLDSDDLIVQRDGRSIPEIFEAEGEERFRQIEEAVLADLVGVAGIVLATGGGAVLREANRVALRKIGIVAWLDAAPEILFERATRSGRRPLLQTDDPRRTFDNLRESRQAIYEEASDFRLDSGEMPHDEVAQRLLEQAMRRYRGSE